jgi:hypothetical protein
LNDTNVNIPFSCTPGTVGFVSSLSDGVYTLRLRVNDTNNPEDVSSPSATFKIDTILPVVNAGADIITNSSVSLAGSATDAGGSGIVSYSWSEGTGKVSFSDSTSATSSINVPGVGNDGVYTLILNANDLAGNTGNDNLQLTWDTTPPVINLNTTNITLEVNKDIYVEEVPSVSDVLDASPTLITNNSSVNTNVTGTYTLIYTAIDDAGNSKTSTRFVNVVDTTPPVITLNGANYIFVELGSTYTDAGASASDNYDASVSVTDNSALVNTNVENVYTITYSASDLAGNTATKTRTVNVSDTTSPIITNVSPETNKAFSNGSTIDFSFVVDDKSSIINCSLIVDGVLKDFMNAPAKSVVKTFSVNDLSIGLHSWKIECVDASSGKNSAMSSERSLSVIAPVNAFSNGEEYTNLSVVENISNVLYFFVKNPAGMINFTSGIDFSSGFDFSQYINISENRISVNSSAEAKLNKSARITFNNMSFISPKAMRDGIDCPASICSNLVYDSVNGIVTFDVTGFSVYSVAEGYVAPPSSGGGGGGCFATSWTEGVWSECLNGMQTRTDTSNCKTTKTTTRACEFSSASSSGSDVPNGKPAEFLSDLKTDAVNSGGVAGLVGGVIGSRPVQVIGAIVFIMGIFVTYFVFRSHFRTKEEAQLKEKVRELLSRAKK